MIINLIENALLILKLLFLVVCCEFIVILIFKPITNYFNRKKLEKIFKEYLEEVKKDNKEEK